MDMAAEDGTTATAITTTIITTGTTAGRAGGQVKAWVAAPAATHPTEAAVGAMVVGGITAVVMVVAAEAGRKVGPTNHAATSPT